MEGLLVWVKTLTGFRSQDRAAPLKAQAAHDQLTRTISPKPAMLLASLRLPGWQRNV